MDHPGQNRQDIIAAFPQVAPKTVYLNVQKLIGKSLVEEDRHGLLRASVKLNNQSKDEWPTHRILKDYVNATPMTNAFANQDDLFKERCTELSHEYSQEIGYLLINATVLYATVQNLDVWKAYEQKNPIDRETLDGELARLEDLFRRIRTIRTTAA